MSRFAFSLKCLMVALMLLAAAAMLNPVSAQPGYGAPALEHGHGHGHGGHGTHHGPYGK